jgi:hypothetical protein
VFAILLKDRFLLQPFVDDFKAPRVKRLSFVWPIGSVTTVKLKKLFGAVNHKVAQLDHMVLLGVDRVAELHDPIHSVRFCNLETSKACDCSNSISELFFLIKIKEVHERPPRSRWLRILDGSPT